ncbi:fumarylacetoacetate hydrolase family protein [Arenicella xantha]|uniref:2-keto-4-pentenoate hydratase/2-oxohepta-3-ene-1,7-dioic acid hydratase in catechol pathway n=1 Tax=Arenicella xantha TaxID=644221 RepID=A0A395JJP3_9GAMM|nr:fumarylacetoacetate hydrolase family protein [Arenicella xantha]RBP48894.1 2-keto-4-pentenoate hydratase/2-oxohepta-3-ene-1,7-dioic acid hydratase in catechol pathway [Arenicella xantha]
MSTYSHKWKEGTACGLPNGKVVCIGKNYADHIKEMNSSTPSQPVLFIKPSTALCDAGETIAVSHLTHLGSLHHELEIALLIGTQVTSQTPDPMNAIVGIGLGIDLTLRDLQSSLKQAGLPWERAKAFDGSCALSAFVRPDPSLAYDDLTLELQLNGKQQQFSNSALMLSPIPALLEEIANVFTLEPGDVVLTGTPAGVGPLSAGDRLTGSLNGSVFFEKTLVK